MSDFSVPASLFTQPFTYHFRNRARFCLYSSDSVRLKIRSGLSQFIETRVEMDSRLRENNTPSALPLRLTTKGIISFSFSLMVCRNGSISSSFLIVDTSRLYFSTKLF